MSKVQAVIKKMFTTSIRAIPALNLKGRKTSNVSRLTGKIYKIL